MTAGPFQQIRLDDGSTTDLFILRYGANGQLLSPQTAEILRNSLVDSSDVFIFSHGWNNTFSTALERYRGFILGYQEQRRKFGIRAAAGYRPTLVGVVWPSTSYVMPWEMGPKISGAPDASSAEVNLDEELLRFVTDAVDPETGGRLSRLIDGRAALDRGEARQAAQITLNVLWSETDPDAGTAPPETEEFLTTWAQLDGRDTPSRIGVDNFGTVRAPNAQSEAGVAGGYSFDPRGLLRAATVWKMKNRAGVVGVTGVGPLIQHILRHSGARLHLIGHSFGARVVLAALASQAPSRPAHSMLLLQAAVNRWCFAQDVAGTGRSGGYRPVLERVEKPVLTTFSSYDGPLTHFFHLALRGRHLGEPSTAAVGDPHLYGALGGFGPAGLGDLSSTEPAAIPGAQGYDFDGGRRVIVIDGGTRIEGKPAISGHGDISNATTWWALHCLTRTD
ncbi:hypothetical protein [Streptomyces sporangiiformans]|uniref:Serine-threonine protein kinase n=1 Tax=Streptomyces sporangiiformans TaxID=2315329 RepID=A0A505DI32_9ACTN|nr:hypothetical protein [Streptomyces sporangiiformans]TPQ22492.1 hypothetical protein FGD71_009540 [Streptomyces sporangiiformans]